MQVPPIPSYTADVARQVRPAAAPQAPRAVDSLHGGAQPGDVLTLPGGALVEDGNRNGFVDGADTVVRSHRLPWPSLHVDVRV